MDRACLHEDSLIVSPGGPAQGTDPINVGRGGLSIPVSCQACNVGSVCSGEHKFELFEDSRNVRGLYFPTGRRSRPYLVRARLAKRKASLLIPSLTPPIPHATLRGLRYSCRIRRELF